MVNLHSLTVRKILERVIDIYLIKKRIIVPGKGQEFIPKYFKGKFDLHQELMQFLTLKIFMENSSFTISLLMINIYSLKL